MREPTPTGPGQPGPRRTLRQTIQRALWRVLGTPHLAELAAIRQELAELFQMTDAGESSRPDIYASMAPAGLPVVDLLS